MLRNYLKIAVRNLRNNMSYSLINMMGLSLGMAGSMLIFLFLHHHLSSDRHQPFFERIYRVVLDMPLDEGIQSGTESSLAMAKVLSTDYSQVDKVGFIRKMPGVTVSAKNGGYIKRFIAGK
jgi:putative ABC transport system permease protein